MNQCLRKISAFLFGKLNDELVMSVAGIHATIISIIIGLSIAYVLHINTLMREVESEALKIAESINDIKFSRTWFKLITPSNKFLENWSSNEDQIQQWLAGYWLDPTGKYTFDNALNGPPLKVYFSDIGLNHTEFKLCLMGVLVLRYPFPARMVMINGKQLGLQPSPSIVFSDIKTIENWRISVEKKFRVIMNNINWFGIDAFTKGFDWNKEINMHYKFWKDDSKGYSPKTLKEFQKIPDEFCSIVESIYNISRALDYKLKRLSYLKTLIPSRAVVIFTLVFSIITFFSGIIIPIIHPTVSKFFIIWIPTMFYSYFLVYIVMMVLSNVG